MGLCTVPREARYVQNYKGINLFTNPCDNEFATEFERFKCSEGPETHKFAIPFHMLWTQLTDYIIFVLFVKTEKAGYFSKTRENFHCILPNK